MRYIKVVIGVVLGMILLGVAGFVGLGTMKTSLPVSIVAPSSEPNGGQFQTTPVVPTEVTFKTGVSATLDGYTVTFNKMVTMAQYHDSAIDYTEKPPVGKVWLVFDVTFTNGTTDVSHVYSGMFVLRDSQGQECDITFQPTDQEPLLGPAIPGQTIRGSLMYVVPESEHTFTMLVRPGSFIDGQYVLYQIKV